MSDMTEHQVDMRARSEIRGTYDPAHDTSLTDSRPLAERIRLHNALHNGDHMADATEHTLQAKMRSPEAHDPVNHPSHYTQGNIECIHAIEASMTPMEFAGFLKGQVLKYQWRYREKGGVQDLKKAQWYLTKHITLATNHPEIARCR